MSFLPTFLRSISSCFYNLQNSQNYGINGTLQIVSIMEKKIVTLIFIGIWDYALSSIKSTSRVLIKPSISTPAISLAILSSMYIVVLKVLDPSTFRGYPRYEVPIRPHILWCRSHIPYKGSVAESLSIFLGSNYQQERGMQWCLRKVRRCSW